MNYNEQTRQLTSDSGYIKRIVEDNAVYTSPMYLGIYDSSTNYAQATEQEYIAFSEEVQNVDNITPD